MFVQHWPFQFHQLFEVVSKRTQEDAGEERVTAKSKPMMNLVWRVRDPTVLASTASENPETPNLKVRKYL